MGILFLIVRYGLKFCVSASWFQPVFAYQIFVFLRFPTPAAAAAILLGFISNLLFGGLFAVRTVVGLHALLYRNIAENFSRCSFKEFPCSAYIDDETLKKAEEASFQRILRIVHRRFGKLYDFQKDTHIFLVERGTSSKVPRQLFAFSIPYYHSYIFLRDRPEDLRTPAKYFVRHEIGHVLNKSQFARAFLWLANRALYFFLFWCLWHVSWSRESILLLILLFITALSLGREVRERISRFRLADEVAADVFALSSLTSEELQRIKERVAKTSFLVDKDLREEENIIRKAFFSDNIDRLLKGQKELHTNIDDLSGTPISAFAIPLLIWLLAQYSLPPSWAFLKGVGLGIILPLFFIIFIFMLFNSFFLSSRLEKILKPGAYPSSYNKGDL